MLIFVNKHADLCIQHVLEEGQIDSTIDRFGWKKQKKTVVLCMCQVNKLQVLRDRSGVSFKTKDTSSSIRIDSDPLRRGSGSGSIFKAYSWTESTVEDQKTSPPSTLESVALLAPVEAATRPPRPVVLEQFLPCNSVVFHWNIPQPRSHVCTQDRSSPPRCWLAASIQQAGSLTRIAGNSCTGASTTVGLQI